MVDNQARGVYKNVAWDTIEVEKLPQVHVIRLWDTDRNIVCHILSHIFIICLLAGFRIVGYEEKHVISVAVRVAELLPVFYRNATRPTTCRSEVDNDGFSLIWFKNPAHYTSSIGVGKSIG